MDDQTNTAVSTPAPDNKAMLAPRISPINRRRLNSFKANRRGFWSLWIFLALFFISLFAEILANDKPLLLISYENEFYYPVKNCRFTPKPRSTASLKQKPTTATPLLRS